MYQDLGGRAFLVYAVIDGKKPIVNGFISLEAKSAPMYVTLFTPREGASEKLVASGFVKQYDWQVEDNPPLYYMNLLESDKGGVYALMNKAGADRNEPPIRVYLNVEERVNTGSVLLLTGKVQIPEA